ncbi:hypothetical protein [Streptomyces uncialis]|uniref:hypothetical protein n=1 Tax=Streptomyces uncialis TaxID=1048205 RepID=UPI00386A9A4B|nr:hypothetical protein OG268_29545 [Streptomyces uncialis]
MTTLVPAAERPDGDGRERTPRAHCIADSAGGLTFDVRDPGTPGDAHLVLLRRGSGHPAEEVRLPLTPASDGSLRAALPSGVALTEGRWDVHAQVAGGRLRRLAPGAHDLRSLLDRVPSGALGHVAVRIPYATKNGNLSVRSWWRAPHAEAGELLVADPGLTVSGRMYGTVPTTAAHAESVLRADPSVLVRAGVTVRQRDFVFTVPYAELMSRPGLWDLWLCPDGADGPRVRIARIIDRAADIADRRAVHGYPAVRPAAGQGVFEARALYTQDNDLSVRVTPVR